MNTQLTLESVQAEFQRWRQNKSIQQDRIPENLKQNAVTLLTDMPPGMTTKTIGISYAMLKTWSGQHGQQAVQLKTRIGHGGEWIDDILSERLSRIASKFNQKTD